MKYYLFLIICVSGFAVSKPSIAQQMRMRNMVKKKQQKSLLILLYDTYKQSFFSKKERVVFPASDGYLSTQSLSATTHYCVHLFAIHEI